MKASWLKGTLVLTLTAFLTKILSLVYKVPYQNMVGDEGLYVFQQVYPLVGIYTVLNGLVLPTIISELLISHGYSDEVKQYIKRSLWIFGVASFALLFVGSDVIAHMMGDMQLSASIRIIGMAFLLIPTLSYMRGVAQTRAETLHHVGVSTTLEQLVRVGMILAVLFFMGQRNIYQIAYFSFLGGLAAPVFAILYLGVFKRRDEPEGNVLMKTRPRFLKKSLYLFLSAGILIVFQLIDSFLVFNSLLVSGVAPTDAMALKGVFDRGLPIIQAATFFVGAIVSSTIPQMIKVKDEKQRQNTFNFAVFWIMAFSIPATLGLFKVMEYLNMTLFIDNTGTRTLQILALQVLFYPFIFLTTAVLQQEERYSSLLVSVLAGILVKLVATGPLTEQLGISGAAISSVVALGVMCLINIVQFRKLLYRQSFFNLLKVGFSTLGMWLALDYLKPLMPTVIDFADDRLYHTIALVVLVVVGIVVYGLLMLIFIVTTNTPKKRKSRRKRKAQSRKKTNVKRAEPKNKRRKK